MTYDKLPEASLEDVAVVALLDPGRVSNAVWEQMSAFAKSGGGVAIFLGAAADPEALNQPTPQLLLPGPFGFPAGPLSGRRSVSHHRSQPAPDGRPVPAVGRDRAVGRAAGIHVLAIAQAGTRRQPGRRLPQRQAGAARAAGGPRTRGDHDHARLRGPRRRKTTAGTGWPPGWTPGLS